MSKAGVRFDEAIALHQLDRLAEAERAYEEVLRLQTDHSDALHLLGLIMLQTSRNERAVDLIRRSISSNGNNAEAHANLGAGLAALDRHAEAVESYDHAIALRPDHAEAYYNRGNSLWDLKRPEDAIASYDRAIVLKPDYAKAYGNRGNGLAALDRHEEAIASYDRAVALQPDAVHVQYNQGLCRLAMGDYEQGWKQFELRWRAEPPYLKPDLPGPTWTGDFSIDGKTILILAEHGLGDALQFCRYLPLLAGRAEVVLEVPRQLRRLFKDLRGVSRIIVSGEESRPRYDAWTPMMSLPLAFRTTLATIPADVPYLHANPERSAIWRDRLAALPGRKIGLVWAGSAWSENPEAHVVDQRRSMALLCFAPLSEIPDTSLISLQKGEPARQARTPPAGMVLHDWTDELNDFVDTAALVEALDLVISVDTSVVHLAGALGKPVWVLNRFDQCWRWLRGRADSPWYPTARLFRQQAQGDWPGVIRDVAEALRAGAVI
jgi:tetratricopeptide (TPR) repeat protein